MIRVGVAIVAGCLVCAPMRAVAQLWEPPPEAEEGGDWEMESADSLGDGALEVDLAASGARGEAPRRARRVRFRGGGTGGALRDGDDPLAGGDLETGVGGGRLRFGRLAPRWGSGLLMGGASDPWSGAAVDRGERAAYRGRAGDGASWHSERGELVAGRFSKRSLLAARGTAGPIGAGVVGGDGARSQASLAWRGEGPALEFAGDRRGRWRAAGEVVRRFGPGDLALRARGGHTEFRSLAEPRRSGPARSLAATFSAFSDESRVALHGALWNFARGSSGSRGALEVGGRLTEHAALDAGFEEQRGPRRETERRRSGIRQGFWTELRTERHEVAVTLRHELWGERAFARSAVRRSLAVRVQCAGPAGSSLTLSHWAWSARHGESLYLPEVEGVRLALRALRGEGERTRMEVTAPVPGGRARLAVVIANADDGERDVRWTAEWSRRGRL